MRVGNSVLDRGNGTFRNIDAKGCVECKWFFVVRAQCARESDGEPSHEEPLPT